MGALGGKLNPAPSEVQLRTTVSRLLTNYPEARLFGFYSSSGYKGSASLEIQGCPFEVVEVRSPLHFHQLAWQSESADCRFICLCPQRDWVDQDLKDRLARRDILAADPWEAVLELFRAQQTDPMLRRDSVLATWALESLPLQGYPVAVGGILTAELFWNSLLEVRLGLNNDCYDPAQLLTQAGQRWQDSPIPNADTSFVQRSADWLHLRGGDLVRELLLLLNRRGPLETLALGIICEVLYLGPQSAPCLQAQGRLELFFAGRPWSEKLGSQFGHLLRQLSPAGDVAPEWLPAVLESARDLLVQIRAEELAAHSLILQPGWDGHLTRVAEAMTPLAKAKPENVQEALSKAGRHRLAVEHEAELSRAKMALRLLRYVRTPEAAAPSSLGPATQSYLDELSWVDRARQRLNEGAPQPALARAFRALLDEVLTRRERFSQSFASLLTGNLSEVTPVESFLTEVAAPLAADRRLLILVMDGCSQAVLLELLKSLELQDWVLYQPEKPELVRVLSALPSVTEVARTSLLSGELAQGHAPNEKEALRRHPSLRAACRKDYPPQIFHKKDLTEPAVYERIRSEDYKVVAVVVNSIDDTLSKDEQLQLHWSSQLIAPLEGLLHAARFRQRLVLLVSDHGHVLDQGTRDLPSAGGAGNRWQPGDTPQEGAIVVKGGRLQLAESARLLWTESIRYGPKKRGYHGGASPQEMVCACALLGAPGQKVPGWREGRRPAPTWWDPLKTTPSIAGRDGQLNLFGDRRPLWKDLSASPAFEARRQAITPPARLEELVNLLGDAGQASFDQLTSPLALSRPQVQSYLPLWMRWLNVDGLPILTVTDELMTLDIEALRRVLG